MGGAASEGYQDTEDRAEEETEEAGQGGRTQDPDDSNIVTPSNFDSHMAAQTTHSNIPVQRLVQSVRQVRPAESLAHN